MPRKSKGSPKKGSKFNLHAVRGITSGTEAKGRKSHNQTLQPGDMRVARTAPAEDDQVARLVRRSGEAERAQRAADSEGKPGPGDQFEARSNEQEEIDKQKVEAFLRLARERFHLIADTESRTRAEMLDDLEFRIGKQWPADILSERTTDGRPALTMNRMPQFIRQVTNQQREQRPSIQINPVGDGATQETAAILQGLIRHIEVNSDAEIAYDTAFEFCATIGEGPFRVITDYVDESKGFEQEILIKRIKNPFTVYYDPAAQEPDYSDARYCFIIEDVPKSEYRVLYKESAAASLNDFSSIGDNAADWADLDTIRVAEYFHVEQEVKTLVERSDGQKGYEDELPPAAEGVKILRSRECVEKKVVWSKINGIEVLDEQPWPGKFIPVPIVMGDDLDVNGKRHIAGLVRHAKDPQRMYNHWVSAATEKIAMDPKAPYMAAEGQTEGFEEMYATANRRNLGVIYYKPVALGGQLAPPPQRQVLQSQIDGYVHLIAQADNDLKATIGLYDASLGQKGPEQSGKAIVARQRQGDTATLNFSDNLSRTLRHTGRLLIDLIPKIYTAPQIRRIINPDNSVEHVGIWNSQAMGSDFNPDNFDWQGIKRIFDIGVGRYDVAVSVGPFNPTRRQSAAESQLALVQAFPAIMPIAGDIIIGNTDWPGHKEIAERMKKTLDPKLLDEKDQDPENQLQLMQSQLQQLMQQHDLLTQALNDAHHKIEMKAQENDLKIAIEKLKMEKDIAIAEITTKAQDERARAAIVADVISQIHGQAHEFALTEVGQSHEARMAAEAAKNSAGESTQAA